MHKIAARFDYSVFIWYHGNMKIMIDIDGCIGDFSAMIVSNHTELPEPDDYSYHKATEWKDTFPDKQIIHRCIHGCNCTSWLFK